MPEETMVLDQVQKLNTQGQWPDYVLAFRDAYNGARDGLLRAGEIYVRAIDEDPERAKEFRAALPDFSERIWSQLELMGRHQVLPQLLLSTSIPYREQLKRLPFTQQKRIVEDREPIELLVNEDDILKVDVNSLTPEQAKQVFRGDHMATLGEQKAWLVDREGKAKLTKGDPIDSMPYVIQGNKLLVKRNTQFTLRDLRNIIKLMTE